jgi:hypothetical protein
MPKDHLADCLTYNNLKVYIHFVLLSLLSSPTFFVLFYFFICYGQGLILSKALKAQKDVENKSTRIVSSNLRLEVIDLRHQAIAKDNILISLVNKLKESQAKLAKFSEGDQEIQNWKKKRRLMRSALPILSLHYQPRWSYISLRC